jgi:hypothetical protein
MLSVLMLNIHCVDILGVIIGVFSDCRYTGLHYAEFYCDLFNCYAMLSSIMLWAIF